jgi:hypothetical protein
LVLATPIEGVPLITAVKSVRLTRLLNSDRSNIETNSKTTLLSDSELTDLFIVMEQHAKPELLLGRSEKSGRSNLGY